MNPDYILLGGIKEAKRLEDYFASHLVDVAFAEPMAAGKVKILVERDSDLKKEVGKEKCDEQHGSHVHSA
jgi:hypothetical protein